MQFVTESKKLISGFLFKEYNRIANTKKNTVLNKLSRNNAIAIVTTTWTKRQFFTSRRSFSVTRSFRPLSRAGPCR